MSNNKYHSAFYTALAALTKPLTDALDCMSGTEEADSGQSRPSQRDMSLRIVIGGIAQNIHNQLYGEIISGNGQKLPNVKDRMDESEMRVADIGDRLRDDMLTNADMRAIEWHRVNEARYEMYHEILSSATTLYAEIAGEQWKPYVRDDNKKAPNRKIGEADKAKLMELIASKRKVPPAQPKATA